MSGEMQETTVRSWQGPFENVVRRPSLLRRLLAWRSARRLQRAHQQHDQRLQRAYQQHNQQLAHRVQEIIAGCGLIQADYSIGGGRCVHIPRVVSVVAGPPVGLDIELLPGQTPDDFTAQTSAIAFHLGVAEVRVIPLPPALIRLELLAEPA